MAMEVTRGLTAASSISDMEEPQQPIFSVQAVQMQFSIASDFVAAQVANGVLVIALYSGRIMRIDLDSPNDIDDIDLPKKVSEVGIIRRLFLDPTASHLIINTTLNENYYLHSQSRSPKVLSRLKGVPIESIAWNPSQPTASTREILVGATDGNLYETYIEPSTEFYKRDEKYLKPVYRTGGPVTGLWAGIVPGKPDFRTVLVASSSGSRGSSSKDILYHFLGKIGRTGSEGSGSVYTRLFESESPAMHEASSDGVEHGSSPARGKSSTGHGTTLTFTPEPPDMPGLIESSKPDRIFAWRSGEGIYHGNLGSNVSDGQLLPRFQSIHEPTGLMALTQWHIVQIVDGRIIASNRLDDSTVYDEQILEIGQRAIALLTDIKRNEYWIFTTTEIFEIKIENEDRDIWKIMLKAEKFEEALQYANNPAEKDAVATASGDYLLKQGQYLEAASVYGKSSKPFEQVSLAFIDLHQRDALRKYLTVRLSTLKKSAIMQRVLIASWLTEILMAKLNSLDDMVTTKAELTQSEDASDLDIQLTSVRREFQDFVSKYKADLDRKTTYDIISSHGREQELLYYATVIDDYNYILAYWIQRENWSAALNALKRQTDPNVVYKYSSVLMANVPIDFVDVLMRQENIEPRKLIPALLNYNNIAKVSIMQNQAVRYLRFEIDQHNSTDAAVHNTLISIYASSSNSDESALLAYLESQSSPTPFSTSAAKTDVIGNLPYDVDFALRLCIQNSRIRSCVHIYSTMGQHLAAIELALQHNEIDLAISVADRPEYEHALRKKLWLAIAKNVISQENADKAQTKDVGHTKTTRTTALSLLSRAPPSTLRIEDLLPLFPDFSLIDSFKSEICTSLESYSATIESLREEMDASAATAARIQEEVKGLGKRWVLVEPGEACSLCRLPLLERRFWVFGCAHGFHADCLINAVIDRGEKGSGGVGKRVLELTDMLERAEVQGKRREGVAKEVEGLIGKECVLCGSLAVRLIDEPFVQSEELANEWAL